MKITSIYVSTPINGRSEMTWEEKKEAAGRRMEELRKILQKEYPDAKIVVPFDVVPPKDDITEAVALGRCITALLECDVVYVDEMYNPDSKGCYLELHTAFLYNKRLLYGKTKAKTDFKTF